MNSNKSNSCREGIYKRSCNDCRYHTRNRHCSINLENECSVDGNYKNWEPDLKTCKKCVWCNDTGGKLFCLLIQDTCMLKDETN